MSKYISAFVGVFFMFGKSEVSSMFSGEMESLIMLICVIIGSFFLVLSAFLFFKSEGEKRNIFLNSIQDRIKEVGLKETDRENVSKIAENITEVIEKVEKVNTTFKESYAKTVELMSEINKDRIEYVERIEKKIEEVGLKETDRENVSKIAENITEVIEKVEKVNTTFKESYAKTVELMSEINKNRIEYVERIEKKIEEVGLRETDRENVLKILEQNNALVNSTNTIRNIISDISNIPESVNNAVNKMVEDFKEHNEYYYGKMEDNMIDSGEKVEEVLSNYLDEFSEKTDNLIKEIENKVKDSIESIEEYGTAVEDTIKTIQDQQIVTDNVIEKLTSMADKDYEIMHELLKK